MALNEQFMVATLSPPSRSSKSGHHGAKDAPAEQSNRVLRVLMLRLNSSKTFGENMIFMLNRAGKSLKKINSPLCR